MCRRRDMELEQKVIESKRLKRELFERDEEKLKHVERYASLQEEAEQLTKKLQKVAKIKENH
jgi:pyruvate/2-oxoacid:ferredoxin oxidoreductase beta subunit